MLSTLGEGVLHYAGSLDPVSNPEAPKVWRAGPWNALLLWGT